MSVSKEKLDKALTITSMMPRCRFNVVFFKDVPELWFQLYVGLFFEKPTIIVIQKKDKKLLKKISDPDKLIKEIIEIEDWSQKLVDEVSEKIAKAVEEKRYDVSK